METKQDRRTLGVLLDCAGGGLMSVERLKTFINYLEKMEYNLLMLNLHDMLDLEGEPFYGYLRSGYTRAELKEIDEYAKVRGIELVPQFQVLGHNGEFLQYPAYWDISDCSGVLLIDEPKTYALIEKMFQSVAETFTSKKMHIGCDEAVMTGLGAYLRKHGYTNQMELINRHLNKVTEIARKYDLQPQIWSSTYYMLAKKQWANYTDGMVAELPDSILKSFPEDVSLVYGVFKQQKEEEWELIIKQHEKFHRDFTVAPDASSWWGFAPQNSVSIRVSRAGMKQVIARDVKHVMTTIWQNHGGVCSPFALLPTLYSTSQFIKGNFDEQSIKEGFFETFGITFDDFMTLDLPNKNGYNPDLVKKDASTRVLLLQDVFLGKRDCQLAQIEHIPFEEYAKTLREVATRAGEFAYLFENLAACCECLALKAELGIRCRKAYKENDKDELYKIIEDCKETANRLLVFKETFRKVWLKDYSVYHWVFHEKQFGGLYFRLLDCAKRITEYLNGETTRIEELEEEILPWGGWDAPHWF